VAEELAFHQVVGMALQLMVTKGCLDRGLFWWIARATSSFPVPLSPEMSTLVLVGPTWRIRLKIFSISGLWLTKLQKIPAGLLAPPGPPAWPGHCG